MQVERARAVRRSGCAQDMWMRYPRLWLHVPRGMRRYWFKYAWIDSDRRPSQAWTGRARSADIRSEYVAMRQVAAGVRPARPGKTCNGVDVKMPDAFWSIVESCRDANIAKGPTGSEVDDALSCAMSAASILPVLKDEAYEAGPAQVCPVDQAILEAHAELRRRRDDSPALPAYPLLGGREGGDRGFVRNARRGRARGRQVGPHRGRHESR
jgi:hypothetical protein